MSKPNRFTYVLLVAALVGICFSLAPGAVRAGNLAPPRLSPLSGPSMSVQSGVLAAGKYSYIVAFSDGDPNSQNIQNPADGASFDANVTQVVAFFAIKGNDASVPSVTISATIDFMSPSGVLVKSTWADSKDSITTGKGDYDKGSLVAKIVPIKGSSNAKLLGTWNVSFAVNGQNLTTESFTLVRAGSTTTKITPQSGTPTSNQTPTPEPAITPVAGNVPAACTTASTSSDPVTQVHDCLEGLGYDVLDTDQSTTQSKAKIAYVLSSMADPQRDFYNSATANQLFYSYEVLAIAWSDSDAMSVQFAYDKQFTIVTIANISDWTTFIKSYNPNDTQSTANAWNTFSNAMQVGIYDNNAQAMLTDQQTKDFATKHFGSTSTDPTNPNGSNAPLGDPNNPANSRVGRVSVSADTISLPPDGVSTSEITIKVYDRQGKPMPKQEVAFTVSGAAAGKLKPASTSTDPSGKAATTYTAGRTTGSITIVAESGGVRGTATLNQSTSDIPTTPVAGDSSATVQSNLTSAGYDVTKVGTLSDGTPYVVMARASATLDKQLLIQILSGWQSLATNYPTATAYIVMTTFAAKGTNYGVVWGISSKDFAQLVDDLNAGTQDKITDAQTIISTAINNAQVINLDTGQAVSNGKDFINKNFGG